MYVEAHSLLSIIQLMGSVMVRPKVIPLSGIHWIIIFINVIIMNSLQLAVINYVCAFIVFLIGMEVSTLSSLETETEGWFCLNLEEFWS